MIRILCWCGAILGSVLSLLFLLALIAPPGSPKFLPPFLICLGVLTGCVYGLRRKIVSADAQDARALRRKAKAELKKVLWRNHTWATMGIIGTLVFLYLGLRIAGILTPNSTTSELLRAGGRLGRHTLHGEPWRIVTSLFLHGSFDHLVGNAIALLFGARLLDYFVGWRSYLSVYFLGGMIGGVASMIHRPDVVSVGASGCVFAVYGAIGACYLYSSRVRSKQIPASAFVLCGLHAAFSLYSGFSDPRVGNAAHLFGLIGGFSIMSIWYLEKNSPTHRQLTFLGTGAVIVLMCTVILPRFISARPSGVTANSPSAKMISAIQAIDELEKEFYFKTRKPDEAKVSAWLTGSFVMRYSLAVDQLSETAESKVHSDLLGIKGAKLRQGRACLAFYKKIPDAIRSPATENVQIVKLREACTASARESNAAVDALKKE